MSSYDWLLKMPDAVLFGTAKKIEKWCRTHDKVRPTLFDLDRARRLRKAQK